MKNTRGQHTDSEINDPRAQWIFLEELIECLATENTKPKKAIRNILLANDLASLRPLLDNMSLVKRSDDQSVSEVVSHALSEVGECEDTSDQAAHYSAASNLFAWPIPSLISWMKLCKLKLAIPAQWSHWMRNDYPKAKAEGLIFVDWEWKLKFDSQVLR